MGSNFGFKTEGGVYEKIFFIIGINLSIQVTRKVIEAESSARIKDLRIAGNTRLCNSNATPITTGGWRT